MRKLSVLLLFAISIYSNAQSNTIIPYILSLNAENSIYKEIRNRNQDSIAFYFENLPENKYKIHVHFDGNRMKYFYSNRKLFINDRFYPIMFSSDDKFFVKMQDNFPVLTRFVDEKEMKSETVKMPTIAERLKDERLYAKDIITVIIDHSIWWIVNEKGELLETNSQ